ncbi:Uncharacterized protein Fot_20342 [Forsythia ovata]|uniref:Uncharacterized protein n=1 Tax=Forsythia ovata TaxID=205694 RepID=A0ABD1VNN3_9LAMI
MQSVEGGQRRRNKSNKEKELDLGSQVSPLLTRPGGLTTTTASSSSSSFGSVSGRTATGPVLISQGYPILTTTATPTSFQALRWRVYRKLPVTSSWVMVSPIQSAPIQ